MTQKHNVAVVRWSLRGRALFFLAVPMLAWLSWYSFTTTNRPSPIVGYFSLGMMVAGLLFQLHLGWYRVRADEEGIVERRLIGQRRIAWHDVQKVECIAQSSDALKIYPWSSSPDEAFHIIIYGKDCRVSVHRWMEGIDEFFEALQLAGVRERSEPCVQPVMHRSPMNAVLNRTYDAIQLFKVIVLVLPVSWMGGMIVVATTQLQLLGNLIVDGALVALVPWAIGLATYRLVSRIRAGRFGAEHACPHLDAKDAILTMAAAILGPLLVWGFAPRAVAERETVDIALTAVGLFFCWIPVAEVRKCLHTR